MTEALSPNRLVRYCPGCAPGVKSWIAARDASQAEAIDRRYLEVVYWQLGIEPRTWPHEGDCPPGCRHRETDRTRGGNRV